MTTSARGRRRAAAAVLLSASALTVAPGLAGSAAAESFEPGSGRARSNLFEVVPRTGGLTIPFSFGRALTQYQGSRAEATATVGTPPFNPTKPPSGPPEAPSAATTVAPTAGLGLGSPRPRGGMPGGQGPAAEDTDECGAKNPGGNGGGSKPPQTKSPFAFDLKVNSDEPDADKGKSESYLQSPDGSPLAGSMSRRDVTATKAPFGTAISTQNLVGIPGMAELAGGRAESRSGVVDGKTRLAAGTVTIEHVSLLGGAVQLDDLRWEATQKTGEGEASAGKFTLGSATVGGTPLPAAPPDADPFEPVNKALAPSGLTIVTPKFDTTNGVARVTPMSLRVNDSPFGREYIGPTVANLQPVRDPLVAAFLSYSCDVALAVTVADVALSGASGSGGVSFDFGGVTATTEGAVFDNPFDNPFEEGIGGSPFDSLPPGDSPLPASGSPFTDLPFALPPAPLPGTRFASSAPFPAFSPTAPLDGAPLAAADEEVASAVPPTDYIQPALGSSTRQIKGKRGGSALAVGLLGLAAVAALGVADVAFTRRQGA